MSNGCLLLNIAGPTQSYCLDPKTNTAFKRTLPHPTKSFVAGLICNAMGYDRDGMMDDDILSEIANLKMHIRIDNAGKIEGDYCSSGGGKYAGKEYGIYRSSDVNRKKRSKAESFICIKQFLLDAKFTIALCGDSDFLIEIQDSLRRPLRRLFFGRYSCIPSEPIILKDSLIYDNDIMKIFSNYMIDEINGEVKVVLETENLSECNSIIGDVLVYMDSKKKIMSQRFVKYDIVNVEKQEMQKA